MSVWIVQGIRYNMSVQSRSEKVQAESVSIEENLVITGSV